MMKLSIASNVEGETLFLTVGQVAKRYNASIASIWRWARNDAFPNPAIPLRANKSETFDCLKFTLEGAGERSNGNARTSAFLLAFFA